MMLYLTLTKYAFITATVAVISLITPAFAAENRCGWLDNPGPGTWWLTDQDARWEISTQGGYTAPATSINLLPELDPNQFVQTNASFGYGCACLSVDTDTNNRRITRIHEKGKQVLLKQCLENTAIANRQQVAAIAAPKVTDVTAPSALESQVQRMPVAKRPTEWPHYVQVITTADQGKANSFKKSLGGRGYATVVTSVKRESGTLYRVNFGPFANRALAVKAQSRLKTLFTDNVNVQESILVSIRPPAPALPKTQVQCFVQRQGQDVRAIQLSVNRDRVSGFYAWQSTEAESSRGFLRGSLNNNLITATHTYRQQGLVSTEPLELRYVKGGLTQESSQLSFSPVNCREVQGLIGHSAKVEQQILQKR